MSTRSNSYYHLAIAQQFYLAMRGTPVPAQLPLYQPHQNPDTGLYRYDDNGLLAVYLESSIADTLLAVFERTDEAAVNYCSVALIINGQIIEDVRDPKYRTGSSERLAALDNDMMRRFAEQARDEITGPSMDQEIVYLCGYVHQYPDRPSQIFFWTGNPEHPFVIDKEVELALPFLNFNAATIMGNILDSAREVLGVTDPDCVFTGMTVQLKEQISNHAEPTPEELIASADKQLR